LRRHRARSGPRPAQTPAHPHTAASTQRRLTPYLCPKATTATSMIRVRSEHTRSPQREAALQWQEHEDDPPTIARSLARPLELFGPAEKAPVAGVRIPWPSELKPACGGGPDAVGAPGVDWQVGSSRARLSEDTSARLVLTRDPQRSCPQKPPGTAQEAAARKLGLHPGA
jgi:hypothetical protein